MSKATRQRVHKGAYGGVSRSGIVTMGFAEIGYKSTKKGKCTVCGKVRQVTNTFTQTESPYNKNEDGSLKTEQQIREQELDKCKAWEEKPHVCNSCAAEARKAARYGK